MKYSIRADAKQLPFHFFSDISEPRRTEFRKQLTRQTEYTSPVLATFCLEPGYGVYQDIKAFLVRHQKDMALRAFISQRGFCATSVTFIK